MSKSKDEGGKSSLNVDLGASAKLEVSEFERLTHVHSKQEIDNLFEGPWITLYQSQRDNNTSIARYCALVPRKKVAAALDQVGWGFLIGSGGPGYVTSNGRVGYVRFSHDGFESLVIIRSFSSMKPQVVELAEELRLFLGLYHDTGKQQFVRIDDNGDDEVVAELRDDFVRIRKPALMEFLAAKQMYLALFFEFDEKTAAVPNPIPDADRKEEVRAKDRYWHRYMSDGFLGADIVSRLLGKRLITPPRRPSADYLWKRSYQCEDFIIGYDAEGNAKSHNSNPDFLADNFGGNEGAPHYLTPVHFRREVLDKYYADPNEYSVEDGYLRRRHFWGMRLDNNLPDRIIAFLGDLGRDLPHREQLHWKSHNILPEGGLSETAFRRQILGQFWDSSAPDHIFKSRFGAFQQSWAGKFGWFLFQPLRDDDSHILSRVHIPSGDRAPEFESQILGLAKLLVDSLNTKQLEQYLGGRLEGEKPLSMFERALAKDGYPGIERDIKLLRDLQRLRSQGAAHRKSEDYLSLANKLGIMDKGMSQIVAHFLNGLNIMLDDLSSHFSIQDNIV